MKRVVIRYSCEHEERRTKYIVEMCHDEESSIELTFDRYGDLIDFFESLRKCENTILKD